MAQNLVADIIEALQEIQTDSTVPRNVKTKIAIIISTLQENIDTQIRINKALNELDEICDDANIQPFTRTQLWNVATMLEKV